MKKINRMIATHTSASWYSMMESEIQRVEGLFLQAYRLRCTELAPIPKATETTGAHTPELGPPDITSRISGGLNPPAACPAHPSPSSISKRLASEHLPRQREREGCCTSGAKKEREEWRRACWIRRTTAPAAPAGRCWATGGTGEPRTPIPSRVFQSTCGRGLKPSTDGRSLVVASRRLARRREAAAALPLPSSSSPVRRRADWGWPRRRASRRSAPCRAAPRLTAPHRAVVPRDPLEPAFIRVYPELRRSRTSDPSSRNLCPLGRSFSRGEKNRVDYAKERAIIDFGTCHEFLD